MPHILHSTLPTANLDTKMLQAVAATGAAWARTLIYEDCKERKRERSNGRMYSKPGYHSLKERHNIIIYRIQRVFVHMRQLSLLTDQSAAQFIYPTIILNITSGFYPRLSLFSSFLSQSHTKTTIWNISLLLNQIRSLIWFDQHPLQAKQGKQ